MAKKFPGWKKLVTSNTKGSSSSVPPLARPQTNQARPDGVFDASSPTLESGFTELESSGVLMDDIVKKMKKQQKSLQQYLSSSEELITGLQTIATAPTYLNHSDARILNLMEYASKFEILYKNELQELNTHATQVQQLMTDWISNDISPVLAEKKKFEQTKRNLEQAVQKYSRCERDEKNPQRFKEATREKEMREQEYLQQGEKAYNALLLTIENTKINSEIFMHQHLEGYYNFFKNGYNFFSKEKEKMDSVKNKLTDEQTKLKISGLNVQKGSWCPVSMTGDTRKIFGIPYQQVIDRDKPEGDILPFLDQCFNYLETKGLTTIGLFRLSPPKPAMDAIREKLDKGIPVNINEIEEVHMVGGLIKLFLRELPAPLLTFELYTSFMQIIDEPSEDQQVQILRNTIARLPHANYVLLERLIYLCTKVLNYTDQNKMTAENLAIVLCPSILYDKDPDPITMVQNIQKANGVMLILISNYLPIFGKETPNDEPPPLPKSDPKQDLPKRKDAGTRAAVAKLGRSETITESLTSSLQTEDSSQEGEEVEVMTGKITVITPSLPALPLHQLLSLLSNTPPTGEFYKQLYELFDGTFMFTRAAYYLNNYTVEELNLLNAAFQVVGKAIKNMLSFIKDYTHKFPTEVGRRMLLAANKVRPHIKSLITYIKAYNSGQRLDSQGLIKATRDFLVGTLQMYLTCNRASQMDELSQSGFMCLELIKQLFYTLKTDATIPEVSLLVNNLQNFTLKFTSLLRAKLLDMSDLSLQQQLTSIVEGAESCNSEIFDEAREMLENDNIGLTQALSEKLEILSIYIENVLSSRPSIDATVENIDIKFMLQATWEQLDSITDIHNQETNEKISSLLLHLSNLSDAIKYLASHYDYATERPSEWMNLCVKVTLHILNIKDLIDNVAQLVEDESLRVSIVSFSEAASHFLVQFKICSAAVAFGVEIKGYKSYNFVVPLKDLAFVTFPFMYNFRDACLLLEEGEQM